MKEINAHKTAHKREQMRTNELLKCAKVLLYKIIVTPFLRVFSDKQTNVLIIYKNSHKRIVEMCANVREVCARKMHVNSKKYLNAHSAQNSSFF